MTILLRLSTLSLLALSAFLGTVSARPQVNMVELHKRAATATSPTEELLTNAARMAAGLGPLSPRQLFDPSRVHVARTNPSSVPTTGRIRVTRASNGAFLGFIDKNYIPNGLLPLNGNEHATGSHLTVSFTKPASSSSLFNILVTSNGNPHHPYLGFAHDTTILQTTSSDFTLLTGTNPTTAGGAAEKVGNGMSSTRQYSESPIWSYDASTGILTNTWFNPVSPGSSNGVSVAVKTYYSETTGGLAQARIAGAGLIEVILTLV